MLMFVLQKKMLVNHNGEILGNTVILCSWSMFDLNVMPGLGAALLGYEVIQN